MLKERKKRRKANRTSISMMELGELFPDEKSAVQWFEETYWPNGRCCGRCGSINTREIKNQKPMPYWCRDCKRPFSVRTGTALESSRLPLRKWAFAVYIYVTNLKSVSSMKLSRDLNVTQKTAWFMLHRLREAWDASGLEPFAGPVEVDESYFGGRRRNMPKSKRESLTGRGVVGKTVVVGMKDRATNRVRAKVVRNTEASTLKRFVLDNIDCGTRIYTDEATAYEGLQGHRAVKHSAGEYVKKMAHINGIESFWSMLKRAHKGTFHKLSPKHLNRYVQEFSGKHNTRTLDTIDQMRLTVAGLIGRRLLYNNLIADNGLDSMARS